MAAFCMCALAASSMDCISTGCGVGFLGGARNCWSNATAAAAPAEDELELVEAVAGTAPPNDAAAAAVAGSEGIVAVIACMYISGVIRPGAGETEKGKMNLGILEVLCFKYFLNGLGIITYRLSTVTTALLPPCSIV